MRSKAFIILFFSLFLVLSCITLTTKTATLRRDAITMTEQIVYSAPADSIGNVFVVDNTLCLFFEKEHNDSVLTLIPLDRCVPNKSFIKYGKDAGQMLLVDMAYGGNNVLVLNDFVKRNICLIDVRQAMNNPLFEPVVDTCYFDSQEIIWFNGRQLIGLNPYSYNGKANRFFITNNDGQIHTRINRRWDAFNVVDGTLLYNPQMQKVVFLSQYSPLLEIISRKDNSVIQSNIVRSEEVKIMGVKEGKILAYYFVGFIPTCFVGADYTLDTIWAAYIDENKESYILGFDWEGELKESFPVQGTIKNISADSQNNVIYIWINREDIDMLVRYSIPNR